METTLMIGFQKILVYVDTSADVARTGFDRAVALAQASNATLKLVDVVPEMPWYVATASQSSPESEAALIKLRAETLETLAAAAREKGLEVTTEVFVGKVFVEIIREVLRNKHDLIVKTTMGDGTPGPSIFGSTALRLLRKCPCPVWLVRPGETPSFDHVVAAIEIEPDHEEANALSLKLVELAAAMAKLEDSRLSIVHALEASSSAAVNPWISEENVSEYVSQYEERIQAFMDDMLAPVADSFEAEDAHLIKGDPREVIGTFLQHEKADMFVLGTVARTGVAGLLMGNTAEAILDQVDCSVLAVKPDGFKCPITLE
jgi:nucleotide-binding universal stress UspA family protein